MLALQTSSLGNRIRKTDRPPVLADDTVEESETCSWDGIIDENRGLHVGDSCIDTRFLATGGNICQLIPNVDSEEPNEDTRSDIQSIGGSN